jgi:glycosyltransferase involved in cell wall biosynthesis
MKLTVVIPAYNEEEAIAAIIERTLAAREGVIAQSPVSEVEVVVVSDGSTDRTAEIARRFGGISLIEFPANRGYGAAIKAGFEHGRGELVGFLDADGTCDPAFFATLCRAIVGENADVAIGSRMGPDSRMPGVRRLGNRIYALILSALSNRLVTDTASGMRVIRRAALEALYPLPDGLHFTPAMSARVLMDERLSIVERPMPYEERVGESKLHVLRDGMRFLHTIFEMSLMWRPARLFLSCAAACLALVTVLIGYPLETWLRTGGIREDMVYRLLFCAFVGSAGLTLLSAGVICEHLHRLWSGPSRQRTFFSVVLGRVYSFTGMGIALVPAVPMLFWLVGPGLWTRVTDGFVNLHWSRVVVAGLVAFGLVQMLATVLVLNLIRFHERRQTLPSTREALLGKEARDDGSLRYRPHAESALTAMESPL